MLIKALTERVGPGHIAKHFAAFGDWLVQTAGPIKAGRDIQRYTAFFEEIRKTWGDIPDYGELVAHFGAEGLRRRRRAVRWMAGQGLVTVNRSVRENDSERRRIAACLENLPDGSRAQQVIRGYHAELEKRSRTGALTPRSIRLSLTPATALLKAALASGRDLPSQETLDALLRQIPGQHAALTGFVKWLRDTHGAEIALARKSGSTTLRKRRHTAREEMLSLLRSGADASDVAEQWRVAALIYFHGLTPKAARSVRDGKVETDRDGLRINVNGEEYWIPTPPSSAGEPTKADDHEARAGPVRA